MSDLSVLLNDVATFIKLPSEVKSILAAADEDFVKVLPLWPRLLAVVKDFAGGNVLEGFSDLVTGLEAAAAIKAGAAQTPAKPPVTPPAGTEPTISGLSPSSAAVYGAEFTLRVTGENFAEGAQVEWFDSNGTHLPVTTRVSETELTAAITSDFLVNQGVAEVSVKQTSGVSASVPFQVG
jgi:hypothetical protein